MPETCIVCLGDLGQESLNSPPTVNGDVIKQEEKESTIDAYSESNGKNEDQEQNLVQAAPQREIESAQISQAITKTTAAATTTSFDNETIAHLLPCGHNLHNECLKPWVERANSCPICRQKFNSVELTTVINGPVLSSYAVHDKIQVADLDPSMVADELGDEFDEEPCPVCRDDDNEDVLLACDGCNAYYHTYCVGLDRVPPGHWFCEDCETTRAIESSCPEGQTISDQSSLNAPRSSRRRLRQQQNNHHPQDRRTRGQQRRRRNRHQASSSNWARVWQSVWDNLNLDLDFPFDDDATDTSSHSRSTRQRRQDTPLTSTSSAFRSRRNTLQHQRDYRNWERRLQVADRQGAANRFRDVAPALLDLNSSREAGASHVAPPESQEEIRAWNALDKAKEIENSQTGPKRKRQRQSVSASPRENDTAPQNERPLKRPRTRRTAGVGPSSAAGPSTTIENPMRASQAQDNEGSQAKVTSIASGSYDVSGTAPQPASFLRSMLREIETSSTNTNNDLNIITSTAAENGAVRYQSPPAGAQQRSPLSHSPKIAANEANTGSRAASPLAATGPRISSNSPSPISQSPKQLSRPSSPLALTSRIEPVFARVEFSPTNSPADPDRTCVDDTAGDARGEPSDRSSVTKDISPSLMPKYSSSHTSSSREASLHPHHCLSQDHILPRTRTRTRPRSSTLPEPREAKSLTQIDMDATLSDPVDAMYSIAAVSSTSPSSVPLSENNGTLNSTPIARATTDAASTKTSKLMPFSTKSDLQRMVVTSLKPYYQNHTLSKDQYTNINRTVSRLLYERVGEAGYVIGEEGKNYFERIARDEVDRAVSGLTSTAQ